MLPEVTDEWANEASEFETVDELRDDLAERIGQRAARCRRSMALREKVVEALVELVDDEVPEALVDGEMQRRLQDLAHRLASPGRRPRAVPRRRPGSRRRQLVDELREQAATAVKADLALRAVAEAEGIEADDDDLDAEIDRWPSGMSEKPAKRAPRASSAPTRCRRYARTSGRQGLEWLVEHVEVVDEEGQSDRPSSPSRLDQTADDHETDDDDDRQPSTSAEDEESDDQPVQLPGPHGRRADEPGRAGLRPLLPAAQGAHHLPRHADRRHDRQPRCAQLLHLESENPDKDINLYINCPGGDITALFAIYDTMQYIKPDISTICFGQAASAAAVLLAAGTKGKRLALPARPRSCSTSPTGRPAARPPTSSSQAKEILRMRELLERDPRRPHRPADRADPQGHRPRLHHDRRRGQGVRHHRRGDRGPGAGRQRRRRSGVELSGTGRESGETTWPSSATAASC